LIRVFKNFLRGASCYEGELRTVLASYSIVRFTMKEFLDCSLNGFGKVELIREVEDFSAATLAIISM